MRDRIRTAAEQCFWDLYSRAYDGLLKYFPAYRSLIEEITEAVDRFSPRDGYILDAGCGTGNFILALKRKGHRVIGIDASRNMLQALQHKILEQDGDALPVHGNIEGTLPFDEKSFDCVLSINALYMLYQPQLALQEMHRVLKEQGKLILCHPQRTPKIRESISEIFREQGARKGLTTFFHLFILGIFNVFISSRIGKGQYFFWNEQDLRRELQKAGFRIDFLTETYTARTNLLVEATAE